MTPTLIVLLATIASATILELNDKDTGILWFIAFVLGVISL